MRDLEGAVEIINVILIMVALAQVPASCHPRCPPYQRSTEAKRKERKLEEGPGGKLWVG